MYTHKIKYYSAASNSILSCKKDIEELYMHTAKEEACLKSLYHVIPGLEEIELQIH